MKTKLITKIALIGALLAIAALAAIACASEPAQPSITAAEIRGIVSDEVSKASAQQVTTEDIQSMVESSMADAMMDMSGDQASAEDIQKMVQEAVASAAAEGASPEEIQAMVSSAVTAATADAVTGADVQAAISSAVKESQANILTSEDMDAAISSAVMRASEGSLSADDVRSILNEGAQDALTEAQVAAIVAQALEDRESDMMAPKEKIVFSDLNWTSAQVQDRIAQYIVEKGYGYPTDVVFGATLPLFNGLRNGDSHVTMEIWLPNQDEAWMEAQAMGEVVSVGESLSRDWQSAFVIPAYLQEQYPDLDNVEDLKDDQFKQLFETRRDRRQGAPRIPASLAGLVKKSTPSR